MDARAFSAPGKHTALVELPKIKNSEKVFVIVVDIIFVVLVIGRVVLWLI